MEPSSPSDPGRPGARRRCGTQVTAPGSVSVQIFESWEPPQPAEIRLRLDRPRCEDRRVRRSLWLGLPLLAGLAWTLALAIHPRDVSADRLILIVVGLLGSSSVAVVGMVVNGGTWAHRLALFSYGISLAIALLRDVDAWWIVALAVTAIGLAATVSPVVTSQIRGLPNAVGPPPEAVLTATALLLAPALIGIAAVDASPPALLFAGLSAPLTSFWFSRVLPGGLLMARVGWPLIAVVLAPLLGLLGGITSALAGLTVSILAWRPAVKNSFHPPQETGTSFPIPPEMTPTEILDAAQIDDTGRPL